MFFADALERKRLARDPCAAIRWQRNLPAKADKVKGWRHQAGFSFEDVVTLSTGFGPVFVLSVIGEFGGELNSRTKPVRP